MSRSQRNVPQRENSPKKLSSKRTFRRAKKRLQPRGLAPAELFVVSFLALILVGTLLLKFVPGLYQDEGLNWTDSAFRATSAVCVTGLIVVDTSTYFTLPGQAVILALIQLGGLGMLVSRSLGGYLKTDMM